MERFDLKATDNTPDVILDPDAALLEFKGKSYPENTFNFYKPILEWIDTYVKKPPKLLHINIKLTYFNSATTQILFDLFDLIQEYAPKNSKISWYYNPENPNAYEDYEDFSEEFSELDFEAIAYDER